MLQERICSGVSECSGNVADNYPDMNKHACRNFILEATTPAICAQLKCSKWLCLQDWVLLNVGGQANGGMEAKKKIMKCSECSK